MIFRKVDKRIELGNILFHILFHSDYYPSFLKFALKVDHTGSRRDYERFCMNVPSASTPSLKTVYAKVEHNWEVREDWSSDKDIDEVWFKEPALPKEMNVTEWFFHKRKQLERVVGLKKKYSTLKKKLY